MTIRKPKDLRIRIKTFFLFCVGSLALVFSQNVHAISVRKSLVPCPAIPGFQTSQTVVYSPSTGLVAYYLCAYRPTPTTTATPIPTPTPTPTPPAATHLYPANRVNVAPFYTPSAYETAPAAITDTNSAYVTLVNAINSNGGSCLPTITASAVSAPQAGQNNIYRFNGTNSAIGAPVSTTFPDPSIVANTFLSSQQGPPLNPNSGAVPTGNIPGNYQTRYDIVLNDAAFSFRNSGNPVTWLPYPLAYYDEKTVVIHELIHAAFGGHSTIANDYANPSEIDPGPPNSNLSIAPATSQNLYNLNCQ